MILTWHNDPALKAATVADMQAHAAADEILGGAFQLFAIDGKGFKGCFLGCLLPVQTRNTFQGAAYSPHFELTARRWAPARQINWHQDAANLIGVPYDLPYVVEEIFESLPYAEQPAFAVDLLEAIPVGATSNQIKAILNVHRERRCCPIQTLPPAVCADLAKLLIEDLRILGDSLV